MGSIRAKGRLVAGVGLEEGTNRAVTLDGLALNRESLEKVTNHGKLASQLQEIEFVEARWLG